MLIALGILIWILCGLVALYLGGVHDRIKSVSTRPDDSFLFWVIMFGPVILIITLLLLSTNIYNLGRGDEKK